jgi:hypothetical protein
VERAKRQRAESRELRVGGEGEQKTKSREHKEGRKQRARAKEESAGMDRGLNPDRCLVS